jgi:hypothetical protein
MKENRLQQFCGIITCTLLIGIVKLSATKIPLRDIGPSVFLH